MIIHYEKSEQGIVTLTIDMADRQVNIINRSFAAALKQTVANLKTEDSLLGVIITSAKDAFLAGGDLDWIKNLEDPAEAFHTVEAIKTTFRELELLGKPVVAGINGSALGGGFELALACHYRIALDFKTIRLGFPEVNFGLLPGGGGIVRLTRLIGLQEAMPYLLDAKKIDPQTALGAGLIDELARDQSELMSHAVDWIKDNPSPAQPWDQSHFRFPGGGPNNPRVAQMLTVAPAMLKKKTFGNYPAPEAIMSAAVEGAAVDFDTASRIESRYFVQVATGKVAKNMINAFWLQMNEIKAGMSRPPQLPPTATRHVGILGAGMMGHGIAYVTAHAGIDVHLKDISLKQAEAGKAVIASMMDQHVRRGKMSVNRRDEVLSHIHPTSKTSDLRECDLIVEAVFEDRELKARVIAESEQELDKSAVFASNTSTLPITTLAHYASRPANFIGLHFFSPVHKMKLVEIICGKETSDETLAKAFDYVGKIGKIPIVVNDSRGFYTTRVVSTYLKEGFALLLEGQHPQAIESAGMKGGMPVGPLALADEVSLSLMDRINIQTRRDLAEDGKVLPAHPADTVLSIMTGEHNRQGKAQGSGFYEYPPGQAKYLWPQLHTLFPRQGRKLSQDEMIERLMFIQALETTRCLQENVVRSVADANIGSILGWGFAPFKGGTLQFINDYGIESFNTRCRQLRQEYGSRFEPTALLKEMQRSGRTF